MLYLSQGTTHDRFLPCHAQADRHYRRVVEEFERLKALHHKLPNEPIFESQPEQNKTTCTPFETNPLPPEKSASLPAFRDPVPDDRRSRPEISEPDPPRLTLPAKGKDVPGPRPRPGRAS